MSLKSRALVTQLLESRFKSNEAIRTIRTSHPVDPKRGPSLKSVRRRRRGNDVKGVTRLPGSGRKLPNMPKLPSPAQPMLKAPKPMPSPAAQQQQQAAEATETAILQSQAAGGAVSTETTIAQQQGPYNDFFQRLRTWFQDNWTVLVLNFGSICTLTGFTRSDILELRSLSMTGSIASIFFLLGQQRILWVSVAWGSIFASVNGYKIYEIYQERNSEVHMNEKQEKVYVDYFLPHGITPKQFERIEAKATKFKLEKGDHLVRNGDKLEHVYLIISGKTKAHILGRHITAMTKGDEEHPFESTTTASSNTAGERSASQSSSSSSSPQVRSGAWVGEMAFMDYYWDQEQRRINKNAPKSFSGRESIYTIMAVEDCEILRWSHEEMSQLMSTSNDMRSALTGAMTSALVSKVVQMTVSKTKQMPNWATWLTDKANNKNAGAAVTVQAAMPLLPRAASGNNKTGNNKTLGNKEDTSEDFDPSLA